MSGAVWVMVVAWLLGTTGMMPVYFATEDACKAAAADIIARSKNVNAICYPTGHRP